MSVNKVIILGRVGADPEVKYMPNGTAVAQLSLATNRKAKNQESILELLNELLVEMKELSDLKKIESLEKDLINNLDENSYSELIKLKNQLNRE